MLFSEITGQDEIKKRLIHSVREGRIPHAQLICGEGGFGTLPLAIAYAQYVSCENKGEHDSCGTCPSCIKFSKLVHPDLHFVFPITRSHSSEVCDDFLPTFRESLTKNPYISINEWYASLGGDGKQGLIYANESDEIIRKLSLKSFEGKYKTMIIWLPEKMHSSCSNKILKQLEEPPEQTLLLLVSNNPDQILGTIQSRTQRINVPPISKEALTEKLKAQFSTLDEKDIDFLVRLSGGNYAKAIQLAGQNEENKQHFDNFVLFMRTTWGIRNYSTLDRKGDALIEMRKFAEAMSKNSREYQKSFLAYAQRMIRENFVFNFHKNELNYLSSYESDFSVRFSPFINEGNVIDIMQVLAQAEQHIERNGQSKIIFADLALKMIMLLK